MSLYNGPARGGNRGGKDQFNWDSVKSDKDREFYLGHSVKATTGRWQKGKDVFWYTREKQEEEAAKARLEMQAIKQREEDLMNEALGLKPKTIKQAMKPKLDSQDMAKLLGRTESEEQGQPDPLQDPDAVKGLGYAPNLPTGVASAGHDVLGGIGIDGDGALAQNGQAEALPGPPPRLTVAELEQLLKRQEKAAKKARKEAKKAKKVAKKAKKSKDKDAERHRPKAEPAHTNGRHQPGAASDSSMSADSDSPPRKRARQSPDHAHAEDCSRARDVQYDQGQDRQRHDQYKLANSRQHQHARSSDRPLSRLPSRRRRHNSPTPEPERHQSTDASRSRYAQGRSHRQPSHDRKHQDVRRHRHDTPSASPSRRRHRSRSLDR